MNPLISGSVALLLVSVGVSAEELIEEAHPAGDSSAFNESQAADLTTLRNMKFGEGLSAPGLGAASAGAYKEALNNILTQWDTLKTETGDPKNHYDVIIQAGHYRRNAGATGAKGKAVSEQKLVAYIVKVASDKIKSRGDMRVLVLSADEYSPGLKTRLFLAVHADGSEKPCTTGPSLSYQKPDSTLAMHAIGWGLSQSLGYKFPEFRKDGFTVNSSKYYMYSKINASVMNGLLEVGEITCPKKERELIASADSIGLNLARAISFVLDATPVVSASNK